MSATRYLVLFMGIGVGVLAGMMFALWEIAASLRSLDGRLYDIKAVIYDANRDDILRQK